MFLDRKPINRGVAKTPVVMQLEALECGAACLAMILAYYSKWVPLEELRKDCGVSRDGVNAYDIARAAELYNLDVVAHQYEIDEIKEEATFPCIIHWNFNHFVVLKGFRHNRVYINDPESGAISISMEEFDQSFTGFCLEFKPNKKFKPSGKKKSVLKFAKKRLHYARNALIFTGIVTAVGLLVNFLFPGFDRVLVDALLSTNDNYVVLVFFLSFSSLALVCLFVEFINAIYSLKIDANFSVSGTTSYMWKVLNLPAEFFSQRYAGDIKSRKDTNATIANTLINIFVPIILKSIIAIFYIIIMFYYSWALSLIGLGALLIDMIATYVVSQKRINLARAMVRDEAKLFSSTVSGISMIETIKSSGTENAFFANWTGHQANLNNRNVKLVKVSTIFTIFLESVSLITDAVVLTLGVLLIVNKIFTVGVLLAFQGFLDSFISPAKEVVASGQALMEMRTEMERIEDVMDYPTDQIIAPDDKKNYQNHKLSGQIELNEITFGYARFASPIIKDFSLKIKPGETIALVGDSGSGKSTLIKLIIGLYEPWKGKILFDKLSLKEIPKNRFSSSVSVVSQDITLFEDSIINNVKMFNPSVEYDDVVKACKDAQIHEEILKRPFGYNARLTEEGKNLSGGQRQRLELARILASKPKIIVLDEATSALDAKTEYKVMEALKKRKLTSIVVAHRLSTIRSCDQIVVLRNGKILDQGKHDILIKRCPYYQHLVVNE
ncbi:MAG: cysteine peptidase family C39 domain-containing protein [Bacilli bacterium]|nr:cysteine peptidase family C39 domain-containing protein [Bacilli bacterium]